MDETVSQAAGRKVLHHSIVQERNISCMISSDVPQ
jgi:hypothetical protein